MEKNKKNELSKKTLFVIVLLIIIFISLVFVIKNINIKNIKDIKNIQVQGLVIQGQSSVQKSSKPSDSQLLDIALTYPQVQAFVAGKQYTTNVQRVSQEDIDEMPVLFLGLSVDGELYLIDFKINDEGLKVIMDDKEVKKVFPITYLSVG